MCSCSFFWSHDRPHRSSLYQGRRGLHQVCSEVSQIFAWLILPLHSGSVFWHLDSERYFGPRVQHVKDSLTVTLRPLEPGAKPAFQLLYNLPPLLTSSVLNAVPSRAPSRINTARSTPETPLTALPSYDRGFPKTPKTAKHFNNRAVAPVVVNAPSKRPAAELTNILVVAAFLLATSPMALIPFVPFLLLLLLPEPPVTTAY